MSLEVANTILDQLGGRRFLAMTGARNLVGSPDALAFSLPRNQSRANKMRITLTPADLYTVETFRVRGATFQAVDSRSDVYAEDLQGVFTSLTGFFTHF